MDLDPILYGTVGLIIGVLISFASKALSKLYDRWIDRRTQKDQLQKDLSASIVVLCDMIEDWDFIEPLVESLREDLVSLVLQIRRDARSPALDLQTGALNDLMALTRELLSMASRKRLATDKDWYRAYGKSLSDLAARLKTRAARLS